jgi:cytoskeletal protein CcmA (bactofilin family)
MPLSQIPTGTINSGPLSLSGNATRTLSTGTYWFTSISITGNGQLNVSGAVKIYVTGSVNIGGNGIATAGNLPPNLFIYGTAADLNSPTTNVCTSISIHGNGNFYGAVYAPSAAISVSGNGQVFGSLTGNTVTINGSGSAAFHYDEALGNLGRFLTETTSTTYTTTGYTRYSWREIAF